MTAIPAPLRTRIVAHGEEAPDQLLANPLNFRRHPGEQMDALRGSLQDFGWVRSVLVNRRTGHVVDGHARVEEALRQGTKMVPVEYIDVSEEEERGILAILDPITGMAVQDQAALDALISTVLAESAATDERLRAALAHLASPLIPPTGLPDLPTGDRSPFQTRTFILSDSQAEQLDRALEVSSKLAPFDEAENSNSNGNALARVAETFLTTQAP